MSGLRLVPVGLDVPSQPEDNMRSVELNHAEGVGDCDDPALGMIVKLPSDMLTSAVEATMSTSQRSMLYSGGVALVGNEGI